MVVRFASGPTTWGVDFAETATNPPWATVLDEIAASGVGALELGPVGYLPEDRDTIRTELDSRSLTAVGSFIFDDLHTPHERDRVVSKAERTCQAIANAGGRILVIIDQPGPQRAPTAGRSDAAPRLDRDALAHLRTTMLRVADVARSHDLLPALHPHAGGYIEFVDEIDWALESTELALCLDTGHLLFADIDPVEAIRRYASRIVHMHLKDVSLGKRDDVVSQHVDFWAAVAMPIFCPLGKGGVDIGGVLRELNRIDYDGYATLEQDRVPGVGTPLDDLNASLATVRDAAALI